MREPKIPDDEPARLEALDDYRILDTEPEAAFDDLTTIAAAIFGVPIALVSLVDASRQWFKSRHGLEATETPREVSFCGHVVADGATMVVSDAEGDARFADNPLVTGPPNVRFYAGAPLVTPSGHALGSLCVIDHVPREPTPEQLAVLEALARQVVDQLELRAELRRRRESEERYATFFAHALDMLCIARDGYFVELNPSWTRVLGWSHEELQGRPFVDFVHEDDRERTIAEAKRLVTGAAKTVGFENRYQTKDGGYRWLSWMAASSGDGGAIYAVAHDITARRQVDAMKSEFVSVVSHELRTPLTSIRGSLRLVEGGVGGPLPERASKLVGIASSNTERLIRLVNDILDLDKIEAGKLELQRVPTALAPLLRKAIEDLRGFAKEAGVAVALDVEDSAVTDVDPDRIQQVAVNLVSNAIKFSDEGGLVRVRLRVIDERARIDVIDDGLGIAEVDQARLFAKFEQVDNSDTRSRGGSGLGLAIAKAIVEEHGGAIGVSSALGSGSTFWFELAVDPRAPRVQSDVAPPERREILIVEDDRDVAEVLSALLVSSGYRARAVGTIAEARIAVERKVPDAAVVDVKLPDGSGLDLIRWLRESSRTEEVPVVVVTGSSRAPGSFSDAKVIDWLLKPFDDRRLLAALQRATRRAAAVTALVVEDDDDARAVLVHQLGELGVRCVEARGGAEAVIVARAERPDLIVLDVGLPEIDGFDVVRLLRQDELRSTPLLVYTGRELDAEQRKRLELGVTQHLTKSQADEEDFARAVTRLLAGLVPSPCPDPPNEG